ncbi:oxidoreductase [Sphaerisporangium krabiense]|nr:oxidoreductase [Sphaerisporangium krabiense]
MLRPLLAGAQEAGSVLVPALYVHHARVAGHFDLRFTEVRHHIRLEDCDFDRPINLHGARLRQFTLVTCSFPGLDATTAQIEGSLVLADCTITGRTELPGARVSGAVILDGSRLEGLDATGLQVGTDIVARPRHDGIPFSCRGRLDIKRANVGGSVLFEGAALSHPGRTALSAMDLTVGAIMNCCEGFAVDGKIDLSFADVRSKVCFKEAHLGNPGDVALRARHLKADEFVLPVTAPVDGHVDLRHARIGVIRDDRATWPATLSQDGLVYQALEPHLPAARRLDWVARDPAGYLPHAYEQLAATYRRLGQDADARTVLLAKQRRRRGTVGPLPRLWGYLQDLTAGYGYRPLRAAAWLAVLLAAGAVFFASHPPPPAEAGKGLVFSPVMYALDLLLPVVDFGQQGAFRPAGGAAWVAYGLIAAGWLLAITVVAAITRTLSRQ